MSLTELCLFTSQPMIQLEKPVPTGTMPVVWPTILDLGRDECKRILRKLGKVNYSYLEPPNQRFFDSKRILKCRFMAFVQWFSEILLLYNGHKA